MEQSLSGFIAKAKNLHKALRARGNTISDNKTKGQVTEIYRIWRNEIRPLLVKLPSDSTNIYEYDSLFDRLLGYSAKTTKKSSYQKDLKYIINNYRKHMYNPSIKHSAIMEVEDAALFIDPLNLPNLRSYLNEVIKQINITYSNSCAVACSLLLRKLIELILYDYYDINGKESEIIDPDTKQYRNLKTIINKFIDHSGESVTDGLKYLLQDIRFFGNTAAHNRRILIIQRDIEKIKNTFEINIRELYTITYLKEGSR